MSRRHTPITSRRRALTRKRRCYGGGANAKPSERPLTTAQIKARVNTKIKKDCAKLYSMHLSHNEKDKVMFCDMLRNYAMLVSPDAHKAAEELRKIASANVKQHWTKQALAKVTKPLDAICEAMWNDTTPEGSDVFRKIHKKGFWNFVSRVALSTLGVGMGWMVTKKIYKKTMLKTWKNEFLFTALMGFLANSTQYLGKNWFKSDSDIAKLIRTGITRKNKNKK